MFMLETDKLGGAINENWLRHRRLGHASISILDNLPNKELVSCLPRRNFEKIVFVMLIKLENLQSTSGMKLLTQQAIF